MPTMGSTDQRVTPPDVSQRFDTSMFSDAERAEYEELKPRKGLSAEKKARRQELRLKAAAEYACCDFSASPNDEPEPEPEPTHAEDSPDEHEWIREHTSFVNAPDAFVLTGKPLTGERLCLIHERLFGRSLPRGRSVSHGLITAPSKPRTAARPRHRRDGSRRHSTRGGTDDSDGPEPEPANTDVGRSCRSCGTDISHLKSNAKFCGGKCRVRKHRHLDPNNGNDANPYFDLPLRDLNALRAQALGGCRCNGSHILDAEFGDCIKCGRPYRDDIPDSYLRLWRERDRLPSYIRAVSYDRDHRVMA